jgi:cytosine deaminase
MSTQLFINAHIATGMPGSTAAETAAIQDILVEDGKFISIAPHLKATLEAQGKDMASVEVVDLGGKLVCPPFCDTHLHLDYVFTARKPGAVNESGTLFEGIQRWSETKADLTVDEIKERAKIGIAKEMRHGVQFIRSHADVTDPNLTSLKALLELKEELKDTVTLQIVSFPQEGMYSYEGPHGESGADLVEEGLKMGADCVGGIPHFEQCREFGERSMHTVVELASKYDKLIDVHCDETDDPNSRYLELLSALAYRAGIGKPHLLLGIGRQCLFLPSDQAVEGRTYQFRLRTYGKSVSAGASRHVPEASWHHASQGAHRSWGECVAWSGFHARSLVSGR